MVNFRSKLVAIATNSPFRGRKYKGNAAFLCRLLTSAIGGKIWKQKTFERRVPPFGRDRYRRTSSPLVDAISAALITRNNIIPGPLIIFERRKNVSFRRFDVRLVQIEKFKQN
jgi:hypothetical protein